jgi:hypothetical protein
LASRRWGRSRLQDRFNLPTSPWAGQEVHEASFYTDSWEFRGRDLNPDSTVQSRMSCLLDDPGVIRHSPWLACCHHEPFMTRVPSLQKNNPPQRVSCIIADLGAHRMLVVYNGVAKFRQAGKSVVFAIYPCSARGHLHVSTCFRNEQLLEASITGRRGPRRSLRAELLALMAGSPAVSP